MLSLRIGLRETIASLTLSGVIEQRHQFSYLVDMHKQSKPTNSDWIKAYTVSYDVLNGSTRVW